jgi:hypothetical protein
LVGGGGTFLESKGGKPGAYGTGGDHDNFVIGTIQVGDGLGQAGEDGVIDFASGAARENACADLDDYSFACVFICHIRFFRERVAIPRRAGRYGRVAGV